MDRAIFAACGVLVFGVACASELGADHSAPDAQAEDTGHQADTVGQNPDDGDVDSDWLSDIAPVADTPEPDVTPSDTGEPRADVNGDTQPDASNPQLPCQPGFTFDPNPPETGRLNTVRFTDPNHGYVYVEVEASGPGHALYGETRVEQGQPPFLWAFEMTLDTGGVWTFAFKQGRPQEVIATCQRDVHNTGPPPEIGDPPDEDCLCGQGDGCSLCRVEGTCFDTPSRYHPNPHESGWQCNDNAGCTDGGSCRIWCPFEPCPRENGTCTNNTEACWIPPNVDDYEEACRMCCEAYGAIWNADQNYCAEPL